MLEVNQDNFEAEVLQAEQPVLVDFWSPHWRTCLVLAPQVEALEKEYGEKIRFAKVNTEDNRRLAVSQKILGLPTFAFYKDGEKTAELAGAVTAEKIGAELRKLI